MEFQELINARRSALNFEEDVTISEEELNKIFELTKLYPSTFNLQHARYYVARSKDTKEAIKEAAYGQHKIVTASATIILCGDLNAYKKATTIYDGMLMLKMIDQAYYDQTLNDIKALYEGGDDAFMREEAIRNSVLSGMLFMLAAKDQGWDTCPMLRFDTAKVKEILNIDEEHLPVMMITVGKAVSHKVRPRGYRRPISEFVYYEQ